MMNDNANSPIASHNNCDAVDPVSSSDWDADYLRAMAWEISERKPAEAFDPPENHVALAMVNPCRGFAHWRVSLEWIDEMRRRRDDAWRDCRLMLRLYDVSYVIFNGLNANYIQDCPLACACGQMFFTLNHAGTWQIAEVGFLLRDGEFVPAARSNTVSFPRASSSSHGAVDALLVDDNLQTETIGNIWDQKNILKERRTPKLRHPLRIALLCMTLDRSGPPEFIVKLATGLGESGHDVHVFSPADETTADRQWPTGVCFHGVAVRSDGTLREIADDFRRAADDRLKELPPFDIVHVHEWLAGSGLRRDDCAKICSLSSLETTRRNGAEATVASTDIEAAERQVAGAADVVLVPGWLRDRAISDLRIDGKHVFGFAMEGRLPNEWETPLDFGEVKREIHVGPLDRLVLFIGPLEYAAGPDLLLEALPVLLGRTPELRVAFAGGGEQFSSLERHMRHLGVEHAVRFLGHADRNRVIRLLRASEALVLPSRYRVPFDDAVVDLARLAARPVITTHGGPAHLVRHEETGIVTYDNPGSIVWALDRILGDPANAQRLGENGRRQENHAVSWNEVAHRYLELCTASFPELSEMRSQEPIPKPTWNDSERAFERVPG